MQKRKEYLDGIKGILCILIMLGHYFGIYKYAVDAGAIENSLFLWLKNNSIFRVLFDESFWLFGFFIISGYLLSYSNINRIVEIGLSVIKRFFRFALPMLGACFGYFESNIKKLIELNKVIFVILLIAIIGIGVTYKNDISIFYSLIFGVILICIENSKHLKNIFSLRIFYYFGNISFGIYSFHFPILLSLGCGIIVKLLNYNVSGLATVLISWLLCGVVTVGISCLYNITVEKISMKVIKEANEKIRETKIMQKLLSQ